MREPPGWSQTSLIRTALVGKEGFDDGDWIEAPFLADSGIRLVQTGNIGIGKFLDKPKNEKFISQATFKLLRCKPIAPGDILICRLAEPIGRACRIPTYLSHAITSVDCTIYRANSEIAYDSFILQVLNSDTYLKAAENVAGGSTRQRISRSQLGRQTILVPPLPEQRRIAEVLDTVDDVIRKTEQLIAKIKQMKQGLLHDLLTRGIDDNGELRDPERHPEQFKDSPLGRIPKAWEVLPVSSLLADVEPAMRSGPFGSALLKHELVAEGVPLLGIDNVHVERFETNYTRFVTEKKAAELSRYLVRPRDVMITIMGTVGRCCVVPDDVGPALSSKHVWTLTFDDDRYPAVLACMQFNHAPWMLRQFARDEQGGIMSSIRSDTLRFALLPVPPKLEAHRIATILTDVNRRLVEEATAAEKQRLVKAGMMEDLLTGRVRTTVLEASP